MDRTYSTAPVNNEGCIWRCSLAKKMEAQDMEILRFL